MNATRLAFHRWLEAKAKLLAASPLDPFLGMVASLHFGLMCFDYFSDQPFELARVSWFGWIAGSIFLLNAAVIARQIVRRRLHR